MDYKFVFWTTHNRCRSVVYTSEDFVTSCHNWFRSINRLQVINVVVIEKCCKLSRILNISRGSGIFRGGARNMKYISF